MKMRTAGKNILDNLKKFWNFIWNGTSIWSWLTFLIVIFIVIKFIFFPAVSFIMSSSLPIVIVESCSMYHEGDLNSWWNANRAWYLDNNITYEQFEKFSLKNGFSKGDIIFVRGAKKQDLEIGDTIIFNTGNTARPLIHRIVDLEPLATRGDNNNGQFPFEKDIKENQIIGKATFVRIPLIGWFKLIFYEPFRPANERGFCS